MKPQGGVLTSGGDCPGLNAVLRGVVLAAEKHGWGSLVFATDSKDFFHPAIMSFSIGRASTESWPWAARLSGQLIAVISSRKSAQGIGRFVPAKVIAGAKKILDELRVKR